MGKYWDGWIGIVPQIFVCGTITDAIPSVAAIIIFTPSSLTIADMYLRVEPSLRSQEGHQIRASIIYLIIVSSVHSRAPFSFHSYIGLNSKNSLQLEQAGLSNWRMKEEQPLDFAGPTTVSSVLSNNRATQPTVASTHPSTTICQGCLEIKKEVQEMKQHFERNMQALINQVCAATGSEPGTTLASSSSTPRKNAVTPECPVALRPLPACHTKSIVTMESLAVSITVATNESNFATEPTGTVAAWSDKRWTSSGLERKCDSNGDAQIDPVGIDNSSDICSTPVSAATKSVISSTDNAAHVFTSKLDSLSSLNPLLLQQQLLQQLVVNGQSHLGQSSSTQLHHMQQQTRQEQQSKQDHSAQLHLNSANVVDQTLSCTLPAHLETLAGRNQQAHQHLVQQMLSSNHSTQNALVRQQRQHLSTASPCRKKPVSDDYVKFIRQKGISQSSISDIKIPVPQAYLSDPGFTPCSEEQIIHQFHQNRRCDDDVRKAMAFLSKMLAEKRVFGTKLMAQTTVAGPNHSTYKNLPEEGIHYIAYVCRKVMMHRIPNEDEFWEVFRDVTRKLAARCRRVRHSKKTRSEERDAKRLRESSAVEHHRHHHLQISTTGAVAVDNDALKATAPLLSNLKGNATDTFNTVLEHRLQVNEEHLKGIQNTPLQASFKSDTSVA
ncbi:Abnormal cell lineage protein 14 [Dirofilaria immitis]|nr:Abnormal cell lineage protein 14 [Dirofilaria immitis]